MNEKIKLIISARLESRIAPLEKRLFNLLFENTFQRDSKKNRRFYSQIPILEIQKTIPELKTVAHLRKALEGLAVKVDFVFLNEAGERREGFLAPLSDAEIGENGICVYSLNRRLPELMADPSFKREISSSSRRRKTDEYLDLIYKLCLEWTTSGQTPFVSLEELKDYLKITDNAYTEFKILNRDVLKPIIREINKNSDLIVELKNSRTGRRVSGVSFSVNFKDTDNILLKILKIRRRNALKEKNTGFSKLRLNSDIIEINKSYRAISARLDLLNKSQREGVKRILAEIPKR